MKTEKIDKHALLQEIMKKIDEVIHTNHKKTKKLHRRNWSNELKRRVRPDVLPISAVLKPEEIERIEPVRVSRNRVWMLSGFLNGGTDRKRKQVAVPIWREIMVEPV